MLSGILAVFQFLAGLLGFAQSLEKEYDDEQMRKQGQLQEQARQQEQKTNDEQIAKQVDAEPTPVDKHRILDRM